MIFLKHVPVALALTLAICGDLFAAPTGAAAENSKQPKQAQPSKTEPPSPPNFYAGLGVIADEVSRLSTKASGDRSFFGSVYAPTILVSARIPVGLPRMPLSLALGITPVAKKSPDGGQSTRLFPVLFRLSREIEAFDVRAGIGSLIRTVSGSGGQSVQRNGTSSSTFALPQGTRVSSILALDLGAGYQWKRARAELDLLGSGVFSSRRAVDLLFTVSYGIF